MNLTGAYVLGEEIEYLHMSDVNRPYVFSTAEKQLWVLGHLERIQRTLSGEGIAEPTLIEVSEWIKKLKEKYTDEFVVIEEADADELVKSVSLWRDKIIQGLSHKPLIEVKLQSGLNPNELRKVAEQSPSEFIAKSTWDKLSDIEKSDLSDAAKCLLLGTATPSVMVALRGAEACIGKFYHSKTKMEPGEKTWRQLTSDLKTQAKALNIRESFIGHLDYIGDAKRNFAQHPNKVYSLREAVIIFMQVVGMIEDVYSLI